MPLPELHGEACEVASKASALEAVRADMAEERAKDV